MQLASSGGRPLSRAALAGHRHVPDAPAGVARKALSHACRLAAEAFELRASVRLVLSELVASWGEQAWERLLVWPSNAHLMRRTGLSERSVRAALRVLIDHRLITPKDSPNGKRYPVRGEGGALVDAYGFDLTPLHAGREAFAARVAAREAERRSIARTFDATTVARRATREALDALRTHYPQVDITLWHARMEALLARTPRRGTRLPPADILERWTSLREAVETAFFEAGNGGEICRHIESKSDSSVELSAGDRAPDSEPATDERAVLRAIGEGGRTARRQSATPHRGGRLGDAELVEVVHTACPSAKSYGRPMRCHREIVAAGPFLASILGAGPAVWHEAETQLGPMGAALTTIYVLQLCEDDVERHGTGGRIRNPGGYLRAVARMVADGRIALEPELLAMRRRRLGEHHDAPSRCSPDSMAHAALAGERAPARGGETARP